MAADLIYTPEKFTPRKVWVQWADAYASNNTGWIDRDDLRAKGRDVVRERGLPDPRRRAVHRPGPVTP